MRGPSPTEMNLALQHLVFIAEESQLVESILQSPIHRPVGLYHVHIPIHTPILCILYLPFYEKSPDDPSCHQKAATTRASVGMGVWMGIADASQVFKNLHLIFLVFGISAHSAHQRRHPAVVAIHPAEHHDLRC